MKNEILHPRRLKGTKMRALVEREIRNFFIEKGFLETKTPSLVPSPGMEPHIRPLEVLGFGYLPTSPEFAMKRLLVGGLGKIFQICSAYRSEPRSNTHSPEFTILEWYRTQAGFLEIMDDVENMICHLANKILNTKSMVFQNQTISLARPWPRLRVPDLFLEKCQIDLTQIKTSDEWLPHLKRLSVDFDLTRKDLSWDDHFFSVWLNLIEPDLPKDRPVIIYHYPPSQAALSVIEQDSLGNSWAKRFEVFIGGLELGNAFEELTDPKEQRARFEKDMDLREKTYGPSFPRSPMDEGFLAALAEGMPPSGGIAMGVDRLIMLFADEPDIRFTNWLNYQY